MDIGSFIWAINDLSNRMPYYRYCQRYHANKSNIKVSQTCVMINSSAQYRCSQVVHINLLMYLDKA